MPVHVLDKFGVFWSQRLSQAIDDKGKASTWHDYLHGSNLPSHPDLPWPHQMQLREAASCKCNLCSVVVHARTMQVVHQTKPSETMNQVNQCTWARSSAHHFAQMLGNQAQHAFGEGIRYMTGLGPHY